MSATQTTQAAPAKSTPSITVTVPRQAVVPWILLLVLAASLWLAASPVRNPPAQVPATAPAAVFSGARAAQHLRSIASQPHTVGSPAQEQVRAYLLQEIQALGLTAQIQQATAALPDQRGVFASHLQNILVRIPGQQSTGVVAIMAHYDSQPNTTGASDNGTAVAGILETMRAIQAGPPLRNDLLFVLTDAEEVDAQGANAFFYQHPWAKEIRVLVNFEAAGTSGASMLLEISPGNHDLIGGYANGVPHPVAYSFLTQLLDIMPLGTDMTVFAEHGVPSLSPMFGWGYHTIYHSRLDNAAGIDPCSIQHQGENALGLARAFGSQDLRAFDTTRDDVFFSLLPGLLVRYPAGWAVPLAALAVVCLAAVLALGFRRRQFTLRGIFGGVFAALALVLAPVVLAAAAWLLIAALHPQFWRNLMGAPYQADWFLLGMVLWITAASLALFVLLRRTLSLAHLTLGAVLWWLVLALLTSANLPGMSYLFTLPALVTTLVLGALIMQPAAQSRAERPGAAWAILALRSLGGAANLLLVAPVILLLYMLMGFWFLMMNPSVPFIAVPLLFVALLLALLAPQMELLAARRRWLAPGLTAALALGVLVFASLTSGFGPDQPMQNGVWYRLDADAGAATWTSFGAQPADSWTAQFFPGATEPVEPAGIYPMFTENPLPPDAFQGPAPAADLPAPQLTVLSDQTSGAVRSIRLHLASPRLARGLLIQASGAPVLAAAVNGNRQTDPAWAGQQDWFLRYYGLTEDGIELELALRPGAPLALIVTDQSDGLPELPGVAYTARGPGMMPFALPQEYMPYPETTSVRVTYHLPDTSPR